MRSPFIPGPDAWREALLFASLADWRIELITSRQATNIIGLYAGVGKENVRLDNGPRAMNFTQKLKSFYLEILDFLASAACHFDYSMLEITARISQRSMVRKIGSG